MRRSKHDVKDSNPLDGSFGGSPVTVTYVVCSARRSALVAFATLVVAVGILILSSLTLESTTRFILFSHSRLFFFAPPSGFEPATGW